MRDIIHKAQAADRRPAQIIQKYRFRYSYRYSYRSTGKWFDKKSGKGDAAAPDVRKLAGNTGHEQKRHVAAAE